MHFVLITVLTNGLTVKMGSDNASFPKSTNSELMHLLKCFKVSNKAENLSKSSMNTHRFNII